MAAQGFVFTLTVSLIGLCEAGLLPEEYLSTPDIIKHWGYPVETHEAVTKDGYILALHRIPHGKENLTVADNKMRPVFYLQHTFLSSSADWVINLPNQSLGFILADKGFDVWMGNVRGNIYSKKHKSLKVSSKKFWDFSFDEHAKQDFPAMVDYILSKTGQTQLYYVGHSQGSLMAFAGLSENQQLQSKIKTYFAVAPLSRMTHISPNVKTIASWESKISWTFWFLGIREFYPSSKWTKTFLATVCRWVPSICKTVASLIGGFGTKGNQTRLPIYVAHTPAGASAKNVIHYLQNVNAKLFRKYDYGEVGNMDHYKTVLPPEYDISKIYTPVVIVSGSKDVMSPPADVQWTAKQLKVAIKQFEMKDYSHMDFIWGIDSGKQLYDIMKYYISV